MDAIAKAHTGLRSRAFRPRKQSGSSGYAIPFQPNKNRGEVT
jgi:hypothetical protein